MPESDSTQNIQVILASTHGTDEWDVSLPTDRAVNVIVAKILRNGRIGFRVNDDSGKPILYRLLWTEGNRYLAENETLAGAGVKQGHTLVLTHDAKAASANRVFISYSHADSSTLKRILIHLKPLEKQGAMDLWVDTRIKAGEKWKDRIKEALGSTKVAILLISADFLASDFIVENELPPLLVAAERQGTRIIPVIAKPSRFLRDKNLAVFQALNDPARPVLKMEPVEQEELFVQLAEIVELSFAQPVFVPVTVSETVSVPLRKY